MSRGVQGDSAPLVTVGVPVYNGEKGIRRALDMLLKQDYPNFEIMISDNASTDETSDICQSLAHSVLAERSEPWSGVELQSCARSRHGEVLYVGGPRR